MAASARDVPPTEPRSWRDRLPNPLEWIALILFGLSVLILVSLLLDPPDRNLRGIGGGTFLSRQPFLFLGAGVYILAGLTAFWSAIIFFRNRIHNLALKAFGITLMTVSFSTLLCICTESRASEAYFGGYVGSLLATSLSGMSPLLAATLMCLLFLISSVFATDWFFYELIRGDAQADPLLDDEDAYDAVMAPEHTETRVTVAVAPAAPAATEGQSAAEPPTEGEAIPAAGPRIMRRVVPRLDPIQAGPDEMDEGQDVDTPEETFARHAGTGAEAVIAAETEDEVDSARDPDAGASAAGIRFFAPESEIEAEEADAEEPPVFMGRIAAYEEEDDDDEDEESKADGAATLDLFEEDEDDADDAEDRTSLDAEDDVFEEETQEEVEAEEPTYDAALEEEIEIAAQTADEAEAGGPPVSRNVFEVIAADEDEIEEAENVDGDEDADLVDAEAPGAEARRSFSEGAAKAAETTPVSAAELALYDDSEAEDELEVEDEPKALVQEDIELEDAESEFEEDEEAEEEVFQLDLEQDEAEDEKPAPRMVFPEALEDLPAERLAGASASAVDPEPDPAGDTEDVLETADVATEAVGEDPFADAPVTGTLFEDALPTTTRKRRMRPTAARVDRAIDDLMPSLGRMNRKINELESEESDEQRSARSRTFETGEDPARA